MALIERLMALELPRLPAHQFQSIAAEWARGNLTGTQAQTAITAISGQPLTAEEVTEAQALVATVPSGTTAANKADRALRLLEIDQVLLMASALVPPYDNPATVRTRLGI